MFSPKLDLDGNSIFRSCTRKPFSQKRTMLCNMKQKPHFLLGFRSEPVFERPIYDGCPKYMKLFAAKSLKIQQKPSNTFGNINCVNDPEILRTLVTKVAFFEPHGSRFHKRDLDGNISSRSSRNQKLSEQITKSSQQPKAFQKWCVPTPLALKRLKSIPLAALSYS